MEIDSTTSEVLAQLRLHGSASAPASATITLRPCWQKPRVRMDLELVYELENVAYYGVVEER